jgi:hypothetical protein
MTGVPGERIEFDSKDSKELEGQFGQMIAPVLKALANAEFSVTIDSQGKSNDFKIPPKLTESFKKAPGAEAAGVTQEG